MLDGSKAGAGRGARFDGPGGTCTGRKPGQAGTSRSQPGPRSWGPGPALLAPGARRDQAAGERRDRDLGEERVAAAEARARWAEALGSTIGSAAPAAAAGAPQRRRDRGGGDGGGRAGRRGGRGAAATGEGVEGGGDHRGVELDAGRARGQRVVLAADEAGVVGAGDEVGVADREPVERQVGLDAAHLVLVERAPHAGQRRGAVACR